MSVAKPAVQTSSHSPPTTKFPTVPDGATHAFTRQHQTTGLQTPYEGPFLIVDRPSRSTIKLEVGVFKDGRKRYEIRHLDDIKFAHPDSLAAPIHRPKLGRPSVSTGARESTDSKMTPQPSSPPVPTVSEPVKQVKSKQNGPPPSPSRQLLADADTNAASNADSLFHDMTGPPPLKPFTKPVRATRNPNPRYIDAIWSATEDEIKAINAAIAA